MKLFILALISMFIYTCFDLKKAFHMLQQNWYNDGNRYLKWINNNSKFIFVWYDYLFILIFVISLLLKPNVLSIIVVIYYLVITYLLRKRQKKEQVKKTLAFTARIKRLCVTIFILYFIPVYFIITSYDESLISIYYLILGTLIYFNYHIVYLANIINKPVEKCVYLYYKTKALRKLKTLTNT